MKTTRLFISCIALIFIPHLELRSEKVPLRMSVEHFTNTYCSVCANRNPAFFNNLNNQHNYTLLTVYPSSPYPACSLNQANKKDNDGRTMFYGIYGSTPRLTINGNIISANANYGLASIFTPYNHDSTAYEVRLYQKKYTNHKMRVRAVIIKLDEDTQKHAKLYVALVEDSLRFDAPNGEKLHRNVLRKSLTDSSGNSILLPVNINDSVVFYFETGTEGFELNQLKSLCLLQGAGKQLIQSAILDKTSTDKRLSLESPSNSQYRIYPNPLQAGERLLIECHSTTHLEIWNVLGERLHSLTLQPGKEQIPLSEKGWYILRIHSGGKWEERKVLVY